MELCKEKEIIYKAETFPSAVRCVLEMFHRFYYCIQNYWIIKPQIAHSEQLN